MKLNRNKAETMLSILVVVIISNAVFAAGNPQFPITGAVGDGHTLDTKPIQAAIDRCAAAGGGTVVIPKGEFVSGALFLKPGVNLELAQGAVLEASTNFADFPAMPHVRFEGHFLEHATSLLNVDHCDHFRLTGPGLLDGNGAAYWKSHQVNGRPRLCEIINSKDVVVSGVRFLNSPQWNLHFYNCQDCRVEHCRFEAKGPSTDGTDIDSSQNITVKGCYYAVNDDCVCLKGNRYDGLDQEPNSPPVENIHVTDCTFVRGMGALVLGTEATSIRDVDFKDSTVRGKMPMLRIKLRPDTAGQDYSDIHVQDIKLDGRGKILSLEPTHGTKVPADKAAHGKVSNVTVENITGTFGSFGKFSGVVSEVRNVTLRNIDVKVSGDTNLDTDNVVNLKMENVKVTAAGTP
ncbi:MAG TPA: glycosyl hydrolase family 28 protein [Verrucomicrobiae bacterium]|nr:glycosyl hydrolase family 28 protein [Verrucomicrobiae bacterium]